MVNTEVSKIVLSKFTMFSHQADIDGEAYKAFGIVHIYQIDEEEPIITTVSDISDQREVVRELIDLLSQSDVHPSSVGYIVEDFLNTTYSIM